MFYLTSQNQNESVTLCISGYSDTSGYRFRLGEGIFLVQSTPSSRLEMIRVGSVAATANGVRFEYTDPDFKQKIEYQEKTGASLLDGAVWHIIPTNYGSLLASLHPKTPEGFIYQNAFLPYTQQTPTAQPLGFFTPSKAITSGTEEFQAEQPYCPR